MMLVVRFVCLAVTLVLTASSAFAQEDVKPGAPQFKEGDVISLDKIEQIKPFLPPEFWDNRDFFFYEGMQLEVGPSFADYSPADAYEQATAKYSGDVKLGPESSLDGYTAGQPFPIDKLDCKGDPQAGAKVAWDFVLRWEGFGGVPVDFYYSYWDRGEELPLYYQGTSQGTALAFRPEPQYADDGGRRVPQREALRGAAARSVDAPFDARGIMLLSYRYKASFGPKATDEERRHLGVRADAAARAPHLVGAAHRRGVGHRLHLRRSVQLQRHRPAVRVEVPRRDGHHRARPHQGEGVPVREGPQLRAVRALLRRRSLGAAPRDQDPLHADRTRTIRTATRTSTSTANSMEPLYSFAYDRKGELWKIIWHNHRWSDDPGYTRVQALARACDKPRDLTVVSDIIVNVQTGTGNRIEFWNRSGTPMDSVGQDPPLHRRGAPHQGTLSVPPSGRPLALADAERHLADRLAIREVACRYARAVDRRDWALAATLFTDDAVLVGPRFELVGRDQILRGCAPSSATARRSTPCTTRRSTSPATRRPARPTASPTTSSSATASRASSTGASATRTATAAAPTAPGASAGAS